MRWFCSSVKDSREAGSVEYTERLTSSVSSWFIARRYEVASGAAVFASWSASASHTADPKPPEFRLPTSAHPTRYQVDGTIDPTNEDFSGTITSEIPASVAAPRRRTRKMAIPAAGSSSSAIAR